MGSQTAAGSAYYPKAMADKLIGAMLEVTSWHDAVQEIHDAASKKACMTATREKDDDKPLDELEKKEVMRWIQLLHERSAHTSMISIAEGLRRQGASAEVIKMAKEYKCPACQKCSIPPPRPYVGFEQPPEK